MEHLSPYLGVSFHSSEGSTQTWASEINWDRSAWYWAIRLGPEKESELYHCRCHQTHPLPGPKLSLLPPHSATPHSTNHVLPPLLSLLGSLSPWESSSTWYLLFVSILVIWLITKTCLTYWTFALFLCWSAPTCFHVYHCCIPESLSFCLLS